MHVVNEEIVSRDDLEKLLKYMQELYITPNSCARVSRAFDIFLPLDWHSCWLKDSPMSSGHYRIPSHLALNVRRCIGPHWKTMIRLWEESMPEAQKRELKSLRKETHG
jgi:hypothetical protein